MEQQLVPLSKEKYIENGSPKSVTAPQSIPASEPISRLSTWERLGLGAGIVAFGLRAAAVMLFALFIIPQMPPIDIPAAEFAAFMAEQSQNLNYKLVGYLSAVQMMFLLPFYGALLGVLRRAESGSGPLAAAVFAAGIVLAVITPLTAMLEDHLMLGLAAAGGDPVTVQAIDGLIPRSFALSGFAQAVVLAATTLICLSRPLIPLWLGWLGYVLAMLGLVGTVTLLVPALFPLAALAMLLFEFWILLLSVTLLYNARASRRARPQQTHMNVEFHNAAVLYND